MTYEIFIIMEYKCNICEKEFEKPNQLSGHMSVHNVGNFHCHECGKGPFENISKLKGHLSVHKRKPRTKSLEIKNKVIKKHICSFCGIEYNYGRALGGHKVNCHLNPKLNDRKEKLSKIGMGRKMSDEQKLKISKSRKKYLDENPGKIPYLLNHSSKESYPERLFRESLIKNGVNGWTQEYPILRYSLDFAFVDLKIDIEIDGSTHNLENVKKIDIERDNTLSQMGWKILRFSDYEIKNNIDEIIKKIIHVCGVTVA